MFYVWKEEGIHSSVLSIAVMFRLYHVEVEWCITKLRSLNFFHHTL